MLAVERRKKITELISQNKSVMVAELGKLFNVTEETIRRDLEKLEQMGILARTYGGATLLEDKLTEIPIETRQNINYQSKDSIGKAASELILDGETVFLDASTSSLHVAMHITHRKGITVITNAEKVVMELSKSEGINVISVGGYLRKSNLSYAGRITESTILNNYYANKAFISCHGVSLSRGLTDSNEHEAGVKKAMIKCSDEIILLCDHSKFSKLGYTMLASLDEMDFLVTDTKPDDQWEKELKSRDINIIVTQNRV